MPLLHLLGCCRKVLFHEFGQRVHLACHRIFLFGVDFLHSATPVGYFLNIQIALPDQMQNILKWLHRIVLLHQKLLRHNVFFAEVLYCNLGYLIVLLHRCSPILRLLQEGHCGFLQLPLSLKVHQYQFFQ